MDLLATTREQRLRKGIVVLSFFFFFFFLYLSRPFFHIHIHIHIHIQHTYADQSTILYEGAEM